MKKIKGVFVLMLILSINFALAQMTISEPLDTYNLGDRVYISTSGLIGSENGNLNIDLVCTNHTTNLVKISARVFSLEEEQTYSIPYKTLNKKDLELENIHSILGECQIIASLGNRVSTTKKFTITDKISVTASLDKSIYNPEEQMELNVGAIKLNGQPLNGFLQVSGVISSEKTIQNGAVREIFSMPKTAEAGEYKLNLFVYDADDSGTLNSGSSEITFKINQVASSIIISLSRETVIPGENLEIKVELYDQSGIEMSGSLQTTLRSPSDKIVETIIHSKELTPIEFPANATAGIWTITTIYNNKLMQEREIIVEELQKANFEIEDSILTITSIGNTIYNKTIELQIGEKKEELRLNIKPGEERKFNLAAPNGEYDVLISDGENSISRKILLTGNAISVKNVKDGFTKNYAMVWIFLTIVLGASSFIFFRKTSKTKKIGEFKPTKSKKEILKKIKDLFKKNIQGKIPKRLKSSANDSIHFTNKSPNVQGFDEDGYTNEDKTMVDMTRKNGLQEAEPSVILKGTKHISSVVSISIKNFEELGDMAKQELKKSIISCQEKGLVDWRENYIFLVFSPLVTKTYHNEILAVKSAFKIKENLQAYNKRFKDKIEFNVGVNSGEMIASKKDGKFKYTSIGNTISFAKRIADSEKNKIIISESIRKKLMRDLKTEKSKEISGRNTYEILEIKDRSKDAEKLRELMKRMD